MNTIQVKDLAPLIQDRLGLVLFESLYELLHFDPKKQLSTFKSILIESLEEYAKYYPISREITVSGIRGNCYQFSDTFESYREGIIDESQIYLAPIYIRYVQNSGRFMSSDYWSFDEHTNTLHFTYGVGIATFGYAARYPYHIDISVPDNDFTEDSKIYFMDINTDVNFLVFLEYFIIRHIKHLNMSMKLGFSVSMLDNLDMLFNELENKKQDLVDTRSSVLGIWKK